MATTRKTASRNYCKNWSTIQRSDQKLRRFWTLTVIWHDDTSSSPSSDSIATTRKTASGNYCRNLSTIQRSEQKLEPFWGLTLVWRDRTFALQSRDSIAATRKNGLHNLLLKFEHDPTVGSKVRALLSRYSSLALPDVKALLNPYGGLARRHLLFTEYRLLCYHMENNIHKLL